VYDASTATTVTSRGHCVDSMVGRSPDTIGKGRATKSMDIVCAQHQADAACLSAEGCYWDASIIEDVAEWPITTAGMCKAEKLGFDCNSYLVFTSTNWNVLQTLDVIAVQDDEDETAPGPADATDAIDASSIGYLYTSRDWYYNSVGSELLSSQNDAYTGQALWSPGTPDTVATDLKLSMFDTRFGLHINRYPWTKGDAELGACTGTSSNGPCGDTEAFLASGLTATARPAMAARLSPVGWRQVSSRRLVQPPEHPSRTVSRPRPSPVSPPTSRWRLIAPPPPPPLTAALTATSTTLRSRPRALPASPSPAATTRPRRLESSLTLTLRRSTRSSTTAFRARFTRLTASTSTTSTVSPPGSITSHRRSRFTRAHR